MSTPLFCPLLHLLTVLAYHFYHSSYRSMWSLHAIQEVTRSCKSLREPRKTLARVCKNHARLLQEFARTTQDSCKSLQEPRKTLARTTQDSCKSLQEPCKSLQEPCKKLCKIIARNYARNVQKSCKNLAWFLIRIFKRSWKIFPVGITTVHKLFSEYSLQSKNKHQIMNVHTKRNCLVPILSSLPNY